MKSVEPAKVQGAFAALREKLIDKTLRNRMINYRVPSARAAIGLEITRELSSVVWRSLVVGRKKYGFTGPADPQKGEAQLGLVEVEAQNDTSDLLLYTPAPKSKRESRLIATYKSWVEQLEERGVNCLYLTLGMLEWREPLEEQSHRAPLVFIPVALERTAKGNIKLFYDDGEISTNLSLKAKLQEYSLELPDIPQDFETFEPAAYFDEIRDRTEKMQGWCVHDNEIALNFFSFEKIALYVDLDATKWPEGANPLEHKDISALLGDGYVGGESPLTDETNVDEARSTEESREVFEADSSQILVILEAGRGTSMVVEGPPGTGKSQTIANLIADFVSRGKKVLFVSEKSTALDVVYRRLESVGLGDASLKLHGQKSNRRSFFEEVGRTWSLQSKLADSSQNLLRLTELKNSLNQYVADLHAPLAPYAASPRRLLSLACTLSQATDEDYDSGYDSAPLRDTDWDTMQRRRTDVRLIQAKVKEMGVPATHPFWGCAIEFFGPDERHMVERDLLRAAQTLDELIAKSKALAERLKVVAPTNLAAVSVLHRCVAVALSAPVLDGVALEEATWRAEEPNLRSCFEALDRFQSLRAQLATTVDPSAFDQDWGRTNDVVAQKGGSIFGRWSREYREAACQIASVRRAADKPKPDEVRVLAGQLLNAQKDKQAVVSHDALMSRLYGVQWQGLESHSASLRGLLEWVLRLEGEVQSGAIPPSLLDFFTGKLGDDGLPEESAEVARLESEAGQKLSTLFTALKISPTNISSIPFDALVAKVASWSENVHRVQEIVQWNQIAREMRDKGLTQVLILAARWPHAAERLEDLVLRRWAREGIERAFHERPSLAKFDRMRHEGVIREFRDLDDMVLKHNRARARHTHLSGLPAHGQVGLTAELHRQCQLKRGHKPIRWAFERFGTLISQIKPVCMMSPLSVAAFLPRQSDLFDVVVFDEASQVKPEDALSAISRAGQVVVVGDSKQMPPTSFFDALIQDDVDEEADFDTSIGKMESILALSSAAVQNSFRRRDLRWHYRSLHQSLIQTSNRMFYEDRLVVFPSSVYASSGADTELGLRFRFNPDAVYDRGSARKVNLIQAEEVAHAVVEHLRNKPEESLMVIAFSKDQQKAIDEALERVQDLGALAEYAALHPNERLDVKNLETSQGDERDVVFISVGYGRDARGAVWMNFGPISREDGGRRLNVLMSRAKKRMEVFSSIRGSDISVPEGRESGVRALKAFLQFAETGILEDTAPTGLDPDSDFEVQVKRAIERRGYHVDCQVGTAGFRIDLAVRHPELPGQYVLGIECDGATYHSARSARDRDKLRQLILESRGWTLHRIWSTDWWMDREAATKRVISAIETAIENSSRPAIVKPPVVVKQVDQIEDIKVWVAPAVAKPLKLADYQRWQRPFQLQGYAVHELSVDVLSKCVITVVAYEGPIHEELLIKRVRESAGFARAGNRMREAIRSGIHLAIRRGEVTKAGDFLYWKESTSVNARSRELLPTSERRFEWIAPEEIDDAVIETIKTAHSATSEEVFDGVKRAFGFSREPEGLIETVTGRLRGLCASGRVKVGAGRYMVGD